MKSKKILGELVTFRNASGLNLDGILYSNPSYRTTVVHVHGSFGNFYQNQFLRLMAKMYGESKINFLSFNLSAHDGIAEGFRYNSETHEEDFEYVGYSVVNFNSCLDDIQGAINFVKPFCDRIILQGHSLGCDRILHYLLTTKDNHDFILIGPANSYVLHSNWVSPTTVEEHLSQLKSSPAKVGDYEWLPLDSYGIKQPPAEVYKIPITRPSLISIMEGPVFQIIRPDSQPSFFIDQNSIIFVGGKDGYLTSTPEEMFTFFERRVRKVTRVYVSNSNHYLEGCEKQVIQKFIDWINGK